MKLKTLRLRIKDKHAGYLRKLSTQVNTVWNYVNELSFTHTQRTGKFFSAFDINAYTTGASKHFDLHSQTIQAVTEEYVRRRIQFKKAKLRWRVSRPTSPRRSLGWVPFKKVAIKYQNGQIRYQGKWLGLWDSYGISQYDIRTGSFSEDSRGRWYLCAVVEAKPQVTTTGTSAIGIDLGLTDLLTCSDGMKVKAPRNYRLYEEKLAVAQRAKNKKRVRAIHAKIRNQRRDRLHKVSRQLVNAHAAIFVGGVKVKPLTKTRLAKSVYDAGWATLRTLLSYKSEHAGVWYEEVNEAYTSQTCSTCGSRQGSPKGRTGLGIREWTCGGCGAYHDRDINAAKNILALGHGRLSGGIPSL